MEEVKIIYCYNENKEAIHYSKTVKGNKYYCIDCGSELTCKDGKIYTKHLAHKNTDNCGGTGESIFHKHWKENLFKAGMFINIANRISIPNNVEILEVLNEVSLNKRYNKDWEKEIIVDTLLVTEKGDIVIEINYKNPKNWKVLKPYYDDLNILRVYEVTVDKNVNTKLEWFCLGEEEEIKRQQKELKTSEYNKQMEKERKVKERKLEREKKKLEAEQKEENRIKEMIQNDQYREYKILFNFKNNLVRVSEDTYTLHCLIETSQYQYKQIKLKFNIEEIKCKKDQLLKTFNVSSGIKNCHVIVSTEIIDGFNNVIVFSKNDNEEYNNRLYAMLCSLQ